MGAVVGKHCQSYVYRMPGREEWNGEGLLRNESEGCEANTREHHLRLREGRCVEDVSRRKQRDPNHEKTSKDLIVSSVLGFWCNGRCDAWSLTRGRTDRTHEVKNTHAETKS